MEIGKYSKTIAGVVAVLLLGALKQLGIFSDMPVSEELNNALEVIITALITGVVIWASPKNKS